VEPVQQYQYKARDPKQLDNFNQFVEDLVDPVTKKSDDFSPPLNIQFLAGAQLYTLVCANNDSSWLGTMSIFCT